MVAAPLSGAKRHEAVQIVDVADQDLACVLIAGRIERCGKSMMTAVCTHQHIEI